MAGNVDSQEEYEFKQRLRKYKDHLVSMVKQKNKFEVEALSVQPEVAFLGEEYSDQLAELIE